MDHDVTTARASLQPMKGAGATVSHAAVRQMEFETLDNACTMPLCLAHYLLHLLPMCNAVRFKVDSSSLSSKKPSS